MGKQTLICLDALLVVDGESIEMETTWVGGIGGLVSHVDLWEEVLSLLVVCGHEVHWLQVPSHIGICGDHKADELADVGHRKAPLLFRHISVNMVGRLDDGAEERC